jgi:ribosome modulation factor
VPFRGVGMDRFNSDEDIDWSPLPQYQEGYDARNRRATLDACPYPVHSYQSRAWNTGWADADIGIISDRESAA